MELHKEDGSKNSTKGIQYSSPPSCSCAKHNNIQWTVGLITVSAALLIGSTSHLVYILQGDGTAQGKDKAGGMDIQNDDVKGDIFMKLGRRNCAAPSLHLYTGYAAAHYPTNGSGSSAVMECLPQNPKWINNSTSPHQSKTLMTAVTYSLGDDEELFNDNIDRAIVPCAVCISNGSTMMVPGWFGEHDCPDGFVREYYGYLMSLTGTGSEHSFASKNYCVAKDAEALPTSANSPDSPRLSIVRVGNCPGNSVPCSDYPVNRRLSCIVCTKG